MLKPLPRLFFVSFLLTSCLPAAGAQIRLAGSGSSRCSGRVEIYHSNTWGTVCDDDWDLNDAMVVCRQIGCGMAQSAPSSVDFGQGTGQIWLDDVACSGSEGSLTECQHRGFGTHNCGHDEDAGVICSGAQIRLAGSGSSRCSGRVEIYHSNTWGTVCDDDWDLDDAMVVCTQLGCGTALSATASAHFGEGTGQIWLDDVACSGSEGSLTECQHRGFGEHNCGHGEDAGVVCSGAQIRLAGSGSSRCSGRVEIYHSNTWGTVCDDGWDLNDTMVVCRELDCGTALSAPASALFGEGTGQIWLDDVACSGSEGSLTECQHNGLGVNNCGHSEDAGVICSVSLQKPSISMNPLGEVTWGQDIAITCSVSTQYSGGTFTLQQTSGSFRKTQTSSANSATFSILQVNFDNEGSYQCQYQTMVSSRDFSSPLSDSVRISVTVSLPKPSITMNPVGMVTFGQDIVITCSISTQHSGGTFTLQQTSGSLRKTQTSSTNFATFSISQVNFDSEGSYQCQYQTRSSSRDFNSPLSDSIRLSVTVSLPKPSISMNQVGEVSWGHDVSITCSISTQHSGGTFTLQQTSGSLRKTQTSSTNSATFSISQVNFDNEGSYQCQYQTRVSSRDFNSPLSDSVRLSVTVPLQQPNISLTSPDGGLVWRPEAAEVTRGYGFVITCLISSHYPGGVFSLIFSGSNTTVTKPAVNRSASFEFAPAEYEHQGNYSCVYEVTLSSRKFISTETTPITVIIKLPLSLLVSSLTAGGLVLLLLLVFIVICLVRTRRQTVQPGVISLTQLAVRNQYVDTEEEEEEEEGQHYMNFEPEQFKRRQEEQKSWVVENNRDEDHDKDKEESDKDNENNEVHCNVESQETYVTVDYNREEEVYEDCVGVNELAKGKESSDTDGAYVTALQPLAEDDLDIYGEQEDIYQNV
ncbi:uncharacterized protein [Trachinotus anak]|uniref:uncharacterized protein isoform X2 n=1 Tax=Trachinotus anak TaxID=443729 RepID=UPI0039F173A0